MSKNLTRKGLAFGALVALGSSVLAGAPAYAADTLVLAANYSSDTTLATLNGETLTLNASLAPGSVAANITQLRYKIVNNGAKDLTATNQAAATTGAITAAAGSAYLAGNGSATVANTVALSVASISTDTTQTATVTAFLDSNSNGLLEAGETQASQTVSFLKWSEATTTTTVAAATAGDTTVTATVKFTNVNNESIAAKKIGAYFTKGDGTTLTPADAAVSTTVAQGSGTAVVYTQNTHGYAVGDIVTIAGATTAGYNGTFQVTAVTTNTFTVASTENSATVTGTITAQRNGVVKSVVAYSATNGGFKYTTNTVAALVKGSAVKVQPLYNGTAVLTHTSNSIGSAQTASVTARTVSALTADFVKSTTAAAANAASTTEAEAVALNSAKSVAFKVLDAATTPAAFAGQTVSVAVTTAQTLSATKTITINGTTYSSNASLPGATGVAKLTATTGADGKAVFTYTTAGFADTNTVVLTGTIENFSATATGTETTRAYSQFIENHEGMTAVTTDGTAVKVDVVVQDQFGGSPADGTYQITATWVSSTQATANATAASGTFAAVVGGKASLSILDNGTGLGTNVYTIARYDVAANGVLTNAVTTGLNTFTINVVAATDVAAGKVTLTATAGGTELGTNTAASAYVITAGTRGASNTLAPLVYSDFGSVDMRRISGVAPTQTDFAAADVSATANVTVYGTVYSASTSTYAGVPVAGQVVTVTGTNKQFSVTQDSAAIWGANTLSFVSDNNGRFALTVYSQLAGKQTVTIKSGTGTANIELYFAEAAVAATKTVSVKVADGAAQFQAGRALDVTVSVADKFGNAIVTGAVAGAADSGILSIAQTGSGYLATTGKVITGAAGTYTTKLITNAGDLGTSTITATVDLATDVAATATSEFGITDVTDISSAGKAIYVNTEFAKGKVVTVYINGVRMPVKAAEATDNAVERKYTQRKAGTYTVTVRVSGGVVASEKIVIK